RGWDPASSRWRDKRASNSPPNSTSPTRGSRPTSSCRSYARSLVTSSHSWVEGRATAADGSGGPVLLRGAERRFRRGGCRVQAEVGGCVGRSAYQPGRGNCTERGEDGDRDEHGRVAELRRVARRREVPLQLRVELVGLESNGLGSGEGASQSRIRGGVEVGY